MKEKASEKDVQTIKEGYSESDNGKRPQSLVNLKMTSHEVLHGLKKYSSLSYQERLRGLRELDALLTQDTITLSDTEALSLEAALDGSPQSPSKSVPIDSLY